MIDSLIYSLLHSHCVVATQAAEITGTPLFRWSHILREAYFIDKEEMYREAENTFLLLLRDRIRKLVFDTLDSTLNTPAYGYKPHGVELSLVYNELVTEVVSDVSPGWKGIDHEWHIDVCHTINPERCSIFKYTIAKGGQNYGGELGSREERPTYSARLAQGFAMRGGGLF